MNGSRSQRLEGGLVHRARASAVRQHKPLLAAFMLVVLAHWAEHVVQAIQIWGLGWKPSAARGVLGMPFPVLISSEWLHFSYALVMLAGLWALRAGFVGRSGRWWGLALKIQIWHFFEHLFLLVQAASGLYLLGNAAPTSVLQLVAPRVELHLFYNAVVFAPMVIAMVFHLRPRPEERAEMVCNCRPRPVRAVHVPA
jgi:hypothetical protein